ncbi:maestro heat-like repeat-containing protein family member 6 isoform X3 [Mauremys reevesii]|uniref:maestro heat-like repeat-containing protein family member 6 isoform X3 n=1 Tax=Mauremys reevesii TaxID=260615 RepID=UPI00193F7E7D|nr:maestro heat-like repeat-containing protein family member 6 isoform X3 [Mauremys reevesii]
MTSVARQDPQKKSKQKSGSVSGIIIAGEGISSSPKVEKNLTLQQEKSQTVQLVAARKGTPPSLKRELSSLWVQEKFQAVKRLKSSLSSPEIATVPPSVRDLSAVFEEIQVIKGTLQVLSDSSMEIKAKLSKVHSEISQINMLMEKNESGISQVGDQVKIQVTKPEANSPDMKTRLCLADKQDLTLQQEQQRSVTQESGAASGKVVEQHSVKNQWDLTLWQGKTKSETAEPLITGDWTSLQTQQNSFPLPQEEGNGHSGKEHISLVSLTDLVLTNVASLKDSDNANEAATTTLAAILEHHRAEMKEKVSDIVDGIYFQINNVPEGSARRAALRVVCSLAEEYPEEVVSSLLRHSLPCDSNAAELWKGLCRNLEINAKVMWQLLRELKQRPRLQESSSSSGDGASLTPLAATRALSEMLTIYVCIGAMRGFYPQLFLALLTQVHYLVSLPGYTEVTRRECGQQNRLTTANHVSCAVESLKTLLIRDRKEIVLPWMEKVGGWDLLSSAEGYLEGVLLLARAMVTHSSYHLSGLLASTIPNLHTEDEERKLTAIAFFTGLLRSKSVTKLLPKRTILGRLEEWRIDPRPTVRWLSLHGLGNMALHRQKVKQLQALLPAILVGLNETHERLVREAITALGSILRHHRDRMNISSICVRIVKTLRPFLDDEQVLSSLVPLLLHLHDQDREVVESCEWTLARCNDFMGWKLLEEIFTMAHYDNQQALCKVCKHLVQRYSGRVHEFLSQSQHYLKSGQAPVRRVASMFTGFIVHHMDASCMSVGDMSSLLSALSNSLLDPEPSVCSVASVSIQQVKQVSENLAVTSVLISLRRLFCCVTSQNREKPLYEDSPFKRKRWLELQDSKIA